MYEALPKSSGQSGRNSMPARQPLVVSQDRQGRVCRAAIRFMGSRVSEGHRCRFGARERRLRTRRRFMVASRSSKTARWSSTRRDRWAMCGRQRSCRIAKQPPFRSTGSSAEFGRPGRAVSIQKRPHCRPSPSMPGFSAERDCQTATGRCGPAPRRPSEQRVALPAHAWSCWGVGFFRLDHSRRRWNTT
jgi:hypothetical protein